ncbi:MAG: permease-like cell division protein FtsX [Elusimicrobiota bacterium]
MRFNKFLVVFIECFLIVFLIYLTFFIHKNIALNLNSLKTQFHLAVFLNRGERSPEVVAEKIRALENSGSLAFVSREKLKSMMSEMKNDIIISGENPFPDTFRMVPEKINAPSIENIVSEIKQLKSVDEVRYDSNMVKVIDTLDTSKKMLEIVLKLIAIILAVFLLSAIIDYWKKISAGFAGLFNLMVLIWGICATLSAILSFEVLYLLKFKNILADLNPGKIFIIFLTGILISVVKAFNSTITFNNE